MVCSLSTYLGFRKKGTLSLHSLQLEGMLLQVDVLNSALNVSSQVGIEEEHSAGWQETTHRII
jgi:hypothetical protein